jgi:putative membrane protein
VGVFSLEETMYRHRVDAIAAIVVASLLGTSALSGQVTVRTSSGEVVTLTQKNVTDHLIAGDSLELEMAKLASGRSQNAAVKDFAQMLVTEHTGHLETLKKLAAEDDIGRAPNPADTTGAHLTRVLTELQAMAADANFDRAFVRAQIQLHTQSLADVRMLRPAAKDDDLQKEMDKTIPVLERHLSRAKQVAAQIGMPADGR